MRAQGNIMILVLAILAFLSAGLFILFQAGVFQGLGEYANVTIPGLEQTLTQS